jgi:hypothetical protein
MRLPFLCALVLALLPVRRAMSDDREQCLAASSAGQDFRDANKLVEARTQLLACAREVCPAVVRRDCAEWLAQVDASMPTVVISVRDDKGSDIVAARVILDDAAFLDRLDGTAVPMNPGVHKVGIETAGMNPLEQQVVIRAGEKNRSLVFSVNRHGEPVKTPSGSASGPASTPIVPVSKEMVPANDVSVVADEGGDAQPSIFTPRRKLALGLASVGGVGLIAGALLGRAAQGKHDDAHALCADSQTPCADAAMATSLSGSAHDLAIGADVAFAVGAAALIGGGVLWFTGGPANTRGLAVAPASRGVAVFGRF